MNRSNRYGNVQSVLELLGGEVVCDRKSDFPLILRPARGGLDGVDWATRHRAELQTWLAHYGAILFRGFAFEDAESFRALAKTVSPELFSEYGDLTPEDPAAGVYGTTRYPEDHAIHFHNESAHAPEWPLHLFFLDLEAPTAGGATRLVDTRRVVADLDPALRQRLRNVPLTYVRTHHPHVDTSWQALYRTDDPCEVERRCGAAQIAFRWSARDTLQTSVTLPSLIQHPRTAEEVLFHQLFLFHPACLDEATRAGLADLYASEDLPRQVRWSSGEAIDDALVRELFALYERHAFDVKWQSGDALMLDNALVAHGREHFSGRRKLLVSMGSMVGSLAVGPPPREPRTKSQGPDPTAQMACVHYEPISEVFLAVVASTPDAVAISQDGRRWTYRELEAQALRTAAALEALSLPSASAIGVTGPRSFELVAAFLGVWMSGHVVVPLDSDLPAARKEVMVADARVVALLFGGETPGWGRAVPALDLSALDGPNRKQLERGKVLPEQAAYIFFTSGSTGRPKGVTGTHSGLAHFLEWQRTTFRLKADDRVAQLTGLGFDVVLRDMFLALTSGATLCLPPATLDLLDPWPWFRSERITRLHAVPSLGSVWQEHATAGSACPTLATVFFAGEPLTERVVRRWRSITSAEIVNLYGPTETTLAKCFFRAGEALAQGVQPIGYPLPGVQILLLDEQGALCSDGETGEIVIRTAYRTLGYLRAEAVSRSGFRQNPFGTAADDIVYYTGDLGRLRPDGALDILGRKDDQIKVLGVRIEPEEIAAALVLNPHVKHAFVTASRDSVSSPGKLLLLAYVVADERAAPNASLRSFLSERLPAALVPHRFVYLRALPLTPNGKVDRKALQNVHPGGSRPVPLDAKSITRREREVLALWRTMLHSEELGVHDDFFELGGHSLLAMQLVARLRQCLGVPLGIEHIFENSTIRTLCSCIDELELTSPEQARAEVARPVERHGPLPLSFAQQRLWFLSQLAPEQGIYNIPGTVRFSGALDADLLEPVINTLILRHASLRTHFIEDAGLPRQVINATASVSVVTHDLSAVPSERRGDALRELALGITRQPFKLDSAPLARFSLIKETATEHVLVSALHHTIADGWSSFVLNRELAQLYVARESDRTTTLAPLPRDYLDFAERERAHFEQIGSRDLDFWKTYLDGAPVRLELPTDRPRPMLQTFNGKSSTRTLAPALTVALNQAFREQHATLFMKLFAAFTALIHELTGARDVVLGIPVARRTASEFESVIGCFINTLAVRTLLPPQTTFETLLNQTRSAVLAALAHQDTPFERVVEALAPPRDPSHHPIFQVLFNYLHFDEPATVTDKLVIRREYLVEPQTKFDTTLYVREERGNTALELVYNADLFDTARMDALLGRYEHLLEECVAAPERVLTGARGRSVPTVSNAPAAPRQTDAGALAAPHNLGAMLAIWREVLGSEEVAPTDDFFLIGGHSLLATQLVACIRARFDTLLPLWSVFQYPTPLALARAVEHALLHPRRASPFTTTRAETPEGELSLDQARLFALHRARLDGHYYNVPRAVRLRGSINIDALHASLQAVVRHHTALHTVFEDSATGPRSRPITDHTLTLDCVDDADGATIIDREARQNFDLEERLPISAALVRHGARDHTLVVTAHHIAADCWSLGLPFQTIVDREQPWHPGIFFADLIRTYGAFEKRQPLPLAPPSMTFADFARSENARLRGGDFAKHAAFFKSQLAQAPRTLDLPTDFPRPLRPTLAGARYEFPIPAELGTDVDRLRRDHRTTLFVPLLAAFGLAIQRWSGQDDMVVGTPVSNRSQPETRNLIGPVGNSVALRVRIDRGQSTAGLITRLRELVPQTFAHQEYPFAALLRDLGGAGEARSPLFQVRFVLQQASDSPFCLSHLALAPVKIDRGVSKYDLSLIVAQQGQNFRGWCEFNTDLFRPSTIEDFVATYIDILTRMVVEHAG